MVRCRYEFVTRWCFDPPVGWHFFKLRVVPMDCGVQRVVAGDVAFSGVPVVGRAVDAFGNVVVYGSVSVVHGGLEVCSSGVVELVEGGLYDASPAGYYRHASGLTCWDGGLRDRVWGLCPEEIMHVVHGLLGYERFVTDSGTSALGALRLGRGVCQDFAHVMLAACRAVGYMARYVCGMVVGEGETHAWVEVYEGDCWVGYDPTYDCRVRGGYVKIAHGRDAQDCAVNRGRLFGHTCESMLVKCNVCYDSDCYDA